LSDAHLVTGNAGVDAPPFRDWFVGYFIPPELGLRSTDAIEVKWRTHALGESRAAWASSRHATTLSVLIHGKIRILFEGGTEALLAEQGDYALWGPGLAHRWVVEDDNTLVLTLRWPSQPEAG
jgi:hypothetical protein